MKRPTNEEMFDWADNPAEWQYLGHATSQEELDELRDFVVQERRGFLIASASRELGRRASGELRPDNNEASDKEFDFASIPLRPVLAINDCENIGLVLEYQALMSGEEWIWTKADAKRFWKQQAQTYAYINGYDYQNSKFSNAMYTMPGASYSFRHLSAEDRAKLVEDKFNHTATYAAKITCEGYSTRFFTHGLTKISNAVLDLSSVEQSLAAWSQMSRDEQEDVRVPRPINFWKGIIAAKKLYDERPAKVAPKTYADLVHEFAPGVYEAPYMDKEVIRSKRFISIDEYNRAAILTGCNTSTQAVTTGFTSLLLSLLPDYRGDRSSSGKWFHTDKAVFVDRALLPDALEVLAGGKTKHVSEIIQFMIDESDDGGKNEADDEYKRLVFGE